MRIENCFGSHNGITGAGLAERAVVQANKLGARLPIATQEISRKLTGANAPGVFVGGACPRQGCCKRTPIAKARPDKNTQEVPGTICPVNSVLSSDRAIAIGVMRFLSIDSK
jgi:hypothetical protein